MSIITKLFRKESKSWTGTTMNDISLGYNSNLYRTNNLFTSVSGSCMFQRAKSVASLEYIFSRKTGQNSTEELPYNHWIVDLFNDPNPTMVRNQFFRLIQYWLDLNGNCFVWIAKGTRDTPIQMHILNPTKVTLVKNNDGTTTYKFLSEKGYYNFTDTEVIHLKTLTPESKNGIGTPLINSAIQAIRANNSLYNFIMRYYENDATPPLLMKTEKDFTDAQKQQLTEQWAAKFPSHKLMAIVGKTEDITPVATSGLNSQSISIKDGNDVLRADIAQVFGVPLTILTGEHTSFASAQIAHYNFWQNTIDIVAQDMCQEFTKFFKKFQPDIYIDFVPFRYVDDDLEIKKRESNLSNGISTINEERKIMGLEPIPEGNIRLIKNGLITLDSLLNPIEPIVETVDNTEKEPVVQPDETPDEVITDEKSLYFTEKEKEINIISTNLEKNFEKLLYEYKEVLISNLYGSTNLTTISKDITIDDIFIDKQFDSLLDKYLKEDIENEIKNIIHNEKDFDRIIGITTKRTLNQFKITYDYLKQNIYETIKDTNNIPVLNKLISLTIDELKYNYILDTVATYIFNKSNLEYFKRNNITYNWLTKSKDYQGENFNLIYKNDNKVNQLTIDMLNGDKINLDKCLIQQK